MVTKKARLVLFLCLIIAALVTMGGGGTLAQQGESASAQPDLEAQPTGTIIKGETASAASPVSFAPNLASTAPVATAEQMAATKEMDARIDAAWAARKEANADHAVAGPDGGATVPPTAGLTLPETLSRFSLSVLTPGSSSPINEAAHANAGKYVFATGNWWAARSADAGTTWAYINPYADFPAFCCDQDVVYDRGRDILLWYRQGVYSAATGQNQFKLSRSLDGGATWLTWTFQPTNVNAAWTGQWFDYPHLALSNDYLYITTNMFSGADVFLRMLLLRLPLDPLAAGAGFGYNYWSSATGWTWAPVQGATETMYLGDNISSAGTFRVYQQKESDALLTFIDRVVPAWTSTPRGSAVCLTPNGRNPCARTDHRITAGWVAKGVIGFFWNVQEGGGFVMPYVNAATFRESDKVYLTRPFIWNASYAWVYGAAAPNDRGDLGIVVNLVGGPANSLPAARIYPRVYAGVDDDYNGAPPPWTMVGISSSSGWAHDSLGDYNRVRAFRPTGTTWTLTSHIGLASTTGAVVYRPVYANFGRERDLRGWLRWRLG